MSDRALRRQRQHWCTCAMLLGYEIKVTDYDGPNDTWQHYYVLLPDGKFMFEGNAPTQWVRRFKFRWKAAYAALEHAGADPKSLRPVRHSRKG
jgi:hypothetical protein